MNNTEKPDYKRCVDISTQAAIREMVIPGLVAIITPILVGFVGGPAMLIGLLTGVTGSGVVLAIFMANSGGAWDNAKKMIESGSGAGKVRKRTRLLLSVIRLEDPSKIPPVLQSIF